MARGRGKATPHDLEAMQHVSGMLQRLLAENDLKQSHLADRLEIPRSSFNEYVKGTALPRPGNVQKIADYFGLKKSDIDPRFKSTIPSSSIPLPNFDPRKTILLSNYDKLNDTRKNKLLATSETLLAEEQGKVIDISEKRSGYDARKRISLPVPGKVSAGTGYWQEDDYDTMVSFYADDIPDEKDYDTVAIVVGHSMEPKIKNGDFLFIKLKDQVDINKIGIFQVDGENYVKKLKSDCLESLNPDYDNIPITADTDFRTIGEVVDIYRG
ncbi:TPA: helix-turn-helix domain-containing protein [Streptococcus suis]|uniref:XRE family transcriptional regulator n=1 Tax=Streptococcus suis TaxID=1307 RepID=UPI0003FB9824|nr:XRE family transcriptional regulator [Streptococcus suis]NQK39191.1 helix-turn-helix domain-containing protein [Streptococcus suis]HEM3204512.1 helix-turn-helix domain-containing protein [Streptococcus suis 93A]HEM3214722.1 helix-turn-helix domain-containing protein [Streptococcus suis]HEM4076354.1 helix-turn-helix domain-containing protein [Streptococcus suis]HEM4081125.1 helix-turn-helix domain-containing protein [Streptococcus suis]